MPTIDQWAANVPVTADMSPRLDMYRQEGLAAYDKHQKEQAMKAALQSEAIKTLLGQVMAPAKPASLPGLFSDGVQEFKGAYPQVEQTVGLGGMSGGMSAPPPSGNAPSMSAPMSGGLASLGTAGDVNVSMGPASFMKPGEAEVAQSAPRMASEAISAPRSLAPAPADNALANLKFSSPEEWEIAKSLIPIVAQRRGGEERLSQQYAGLEQKNQQSVMNNSLKALAIKADDLRSLRQNQMDMAKLMMKFRQTKDGQSLKDLQKLASLQAQIAGSKGQLLNAMAMAGMFGADPNSPERLQADNLMRQYISFQGEAEQTLNNLGSLTAGAPNQGAPKVQTPEAKKAPDGPALDPSLQSPEALQKLGFSSAEIQVMLGSK